MRCDRREFLGAVTLALLAPGVARSYPRADEVMTGEDRMAVADLGRALAGPADARPPILQVGAQSLYRRGHIPGARYAGMASTAEGLASLDRLLASFAPSAPAVLYCGCCPWSHCANVAPAFRRARERGYRRVRVLYLPSDFTTDWIDAGYPVETNQTDA
jgi:thiosulfate/3-mercaptopyruvate sulfurtransferase